MGAAGRRGEIRRDADGEPYLSESELEALELSLQARDLDPEEWFDHWSEELATLYHALVDHAQANGWPLLDRSRFPDFVDFAYSHSTKTAPPPQ